MCERETGLGVNQLPSDPLGEARKNKGQELGPAVGLLQGTWQLREDCFLVEAQSGGNVAQEGPLC